jgi:hypothetical protein
MSGRGHLGGQGAWHGLDDHRLGGVGDDLKGGVIEHHLGVRAGRVGAGFEHPLQRVLDRFEMIK